MQLIFPVIYTSVLTAYIWISFMLFTKIYNLPGLVVDEVFHIKQGEIICYDNSSYYDDKITTPPGLYWASKFTTGMFGLCDKYWLRLLSFACGLVNIELFRRLISISKADKGQSQHAPIEVEYRTKLLKKICELLGAVNMTIFPPMYFFYMIYYTDALSITVVLLMLYLSKTDKQLVACLLGYMSLLIRQTNIIWITLVVGEYIFATLIEIGWKAKIEDRFSFKMIYTVTTIKTRGGVRKDLFTLKQFLNIFCYGTIYVIFLIALYLNDWSLVLGDKQAHKVSSHIMQIFYYSAFCFVFCFPFFISEAKLVLNFLRKRLLFTVAVSIVVGILIYSNTIIHPFLRADNRHYTFYFVKNILLNWSKYLLIPVYVFSLIAHGIIYLRKNTFLTYLIYFFGTMAVIVPQGLIEIRYFLMPYYIFRSRIHTNNKWLLLSETAINVSINFVYFYIFFTKEVHWSDYKEPQRIIW